MATNSNPVIEQGVLNQAVENISDCKGTPSFNEEDIADQIESASCGNSGLCDDPQGLVPIASVGGQTSSVVLEAAANSLTSGVERVPNAAGYRIQVRLVTGNFTTALKNALIRDLNS